MNCYFCSSIPEPSGLAVLDEPESRHAATARRQQAGDRVLLIDGRGRRARGVIVSITRRSAEIEIECVSYVGKRKPLIILACAIAKGDRQKVVLDMATQLGIDEYVPLNCERSVVKPNARSIERWLRVCTEACKQSHNPYLPRISPAETPDSLATRMKRAYIPLVVAQAGGASTSSVIRTDAVVICIGPEGGFSDTEKMQLADSGARFLSLGQNILRIETAAVAAVSTFRMSS